MDNQTTTLKKRKLTSESSRNTPGSILRSLLMFLTAPPSKTRIFGLKTQCLERKNKFAQSLILVSKRFRLDGPWELRVIYEISEKRLQ